MSEELTPKIARQDAAFAFEQSLEDPLARELVANACALVWMKFCEGEDLPSSDFDLEFFARVIRELFADRAHFLALLRAAARPADLTTIAGRTLRHFTTDHERISLN